MPTKRRDHKAEYARRIAHGAAKGLSRSQSRGHPRATERSTASPHRQRPISDERLQLALKVLRQDKSLGAAAKAAKIAPERLRSFAIQRGLLERDGRRWNVKQRLPRRMLLFSDGKAIQIVLSDFGTASSIGRFMSAVSAFLKSNNPKHLSEFVGMSVTDNSGTTHRFETRPNVLYRLSQTGDQSFEQIYRIVI